MLRAALIGFPITGKSTLFQLLTEAREPGRTPAPGKADAPLGIARVPDERLDRLTALFKPRKRVPATVELADTPGPGQSGAQSLVDVAAYRNADTLVHVVRAFRDPSIPHAVGDVNPARDVRAMEDELILADLGVAERRLERLARDLKKMRTADLEHEHAILGRCREALERGVPLRALELSGDEGRRLRGFQFLSAKPLLVVVNVDEADVGAMPRVVEIAGLESQRTAPATRIAAVCAKIELEIGQLADDDARAFLTDLGLSESGLDRIIRATYDLLGYISFFTVGEDECRAWSIPRGSSAVVAAGEIHSDIARGFIRAEVVRHEALLARGSLAACREHAELRLEGKEYVVADGDVINFRFAT
jgi:GTP-binding protein YchF